MSQFSLESLNEFFNKSIIHEFNIPKINNSKIELFVKRDDLIHHEFSGNKLRKLKYNLKAYFENNCEGILTFGGAFSNHLLATASACHKFYIPCVGIVRGEELNEKSNKLLERCADLGMKLLFYSRIEFQEMKKRSGNVFFDGKQYWVIPEGGANQEGVQGCRELVTDSQIDYIIVAQGTSTTSLGILLQLNDFQKIIVVPVLKGYDSIQEMKSLLKNDNYFETIQQKIIVLDGFHFGGYARTSDELDQFISLFNQTNQFTIEPVYTGKVLFALNQWLGSLELAQNKKVLFVHTGGLHNY